MDAVWIQRFNSQSIDGLSVGVKDNIDIAGYHTTIGSAALQERQPAHLNADVVTRLEQAGFCLAGKTALHELAFGMTGVNRFSGTPVNPKFRDRIPGGSSSGSAVAVARHDVDVAVGTDTGGSVRVPAACCGVIGFKPTFGRVNRDGVLPAESSLDCVGTFARNMDDLIQLQSAIDPLFSISTHSSTKISDLQCALYTEHAIGPVVSTVTEYLCAKALNLNSVSLPLFNDAFQASMTLIAYETYQAFGHLLSSPALGEDIRQRLVNASVLTSEDLVRANETRHQFCEQVDYMFDQYDLLITPALPHFPLKVTDAFAGIQDLNISFFSRPFNLTGHPAIVLPVHTDLPGPVAIQLIAAKGKDARLCELAQTLTNY